MRNLTQARGGQVLAIEALTPRAVEENMSQHEDDMSQHSTTTGTGTSSRLLMILQ